MNRHQTSEFTLSMMRVTHRFLGALKACTLTFINQFDEQVVRLLKKDRARNAQ